MKIHDFTHHNSSEGVFIDWDVRIKSNHIVRVISYFIDNLDYVSLGIKDRSSGSSYSSGELLKLLLLGYTLGVTSKRKLHELSVSNLYAIWILKDTQPSESSILSFIKENLPYFSLVFREFNKRLIDASLIDFKEIGVDGTKIRGFNARSKNVTSAKIATKLKHYDKEIEKYTKMLELEEDALNDYEEALKNLNLLNLKKKN